MRDEAINAERDGSGGPALIRPLAVLLVAEVVRVALIGLDLLMPTVDTIDPSTGLFSVSDPLSAVRPAISALDAILYVVEIVMTCVLIARLAGSGRGPAARRLTVGLVVALVLAALLLQFGNFWGSGGAPFLVALGVLLPMAMADTQGAEFAVLLLLSAIIAVLVVGLRTGGSGAPQTAAASSTGAGAAGQMVQKRVKHRHALHGLLARTALTPEEVLRIADACAAAQESDFFRGIGPVVVQGRHDGWLELAGMGGIGNRHRQIGFTLLATPDAGDTVVRTLLTSYRTSQNKLYWVIPAGPKLMIGYHSYESFLTRIKATIEDADPAAQVVISDAADIQRVPAARG